MFVSRVSVVGMLAFFPLGCDRASVGAGGSDPSDASSSPEDSSTDTGTESTGASNSSETSSSGSTESGSAETGTPEPIDVFGSCEAPTASTSAEIWETVNVDETCTEGFFDGSSGGYGFTFDCPSGEFEINFNVSPDLPSGWWPEQSEYEVRLRQVGEELWLQADYPSGDLFLAAVNASTATPPGEPDFFAPLSLSLVSADCGWDESPCFADEAAAIEVAGLSPDPLTFISNAHQRLGENGQHSVWTGEVSIVHANPPTGPEGCDPTERPNRIHVLVHGGEQ